MKIQTWTPSMSLEDTKNLAYWERNVLALKYADGWYNDDVLDPSHISVGPNGMGFGGNLKPRFDGWRRVLSLDGGKITFHIPDDFEVGNLPEIERNWDGHTTEEKWTRILKEKGIG